MNYQLTKTDFILGLICPKYLWLKVNEPEKIRKATNAEEFDINEGYKVGELAKQLYVDGINLPIEDITENIKQTKELLKEKQPLFEAGFLSANCFARVDILLPNGNGWDIIEVKSSNSLKEKHKLDVSFQKFVLESNGLNIKKCFLLHLNRDYNKKGEIEIEQIFTKENITEEANFLATKIGKMVDIIIGILNSKTPPKAGILLPEKIIKDNNHKCLKDGCLELEENNVFCLYGDKKPARELFENGIKYIKDTPESYVLSKREQQIQKECIINDKPYIEKEKIVEFLKKLQFPLYFLDFETFSTAIPMFNGLSPHAKVPFQFSLHIIDKKEKKPKHYEFLFEKEGDPRENFLEALKKVIGTSGSILVYYESFERDRLKELTEQFPKHQRWIYPVINRLVDLRTPFRKFWYYHPKQQGSASIKAILSAITEMCYDELEIRDGRSAHVEFLRITCDECDENEKTKVREDLLKYCKLDTLAQVKIIEKLRELVK